MQRLSALLRQTPSLMTSVRGPKKKGQVQAKIQSNDIINIFKDRPDPEPTDIKQYPLFVQQMARGPHSIHQLHEGAVLNLDYMIPAAPHYKQFLRGLKRQRFKAVRQFVQIDSKPIDWIDERSIMNRLAVYDFFSKTKEQEEEERKKAQAEEALEDDDDDF